MSEQSEDSLFTNYLTNFVYSNYKTCISEIDELISKFPNSESKNSYVIHKSICFIKLKKYEDALKTIETLNDNASINNTFNFLLTKGKIYFFLNKFLESKQIFNNALKLINAGDTEGINLITPWLNKVDVELKEGGVIDYNTFNKGEIKMIYNWIQTNSDITIDVTSNHNLNAYEIKFEKKKVNFIDKKENVIKYSINLTNGIVPEKSAVKSVNGMNCKLNLIKEVPDFKWVNLEINSASTTVTSTNNNNNNEYLYPTSSKVKKDWSKLDKEFELEEKEDAKNDPNNGMWRLFREIYANGNEETRRAMIKSFQTSGGTVLSTNWGEVKDKDYEGKDRPEAPKGQEWVKPEK